MVKYKMKANSKKDDIKILKNKSLREYNIYTENGLTFTEIIRQEYSGNNCIISAGYVEGEGKPEVDIIYLRLAKDGVDPTLLLLRPDEAQIISWVSSGVVWSYLMDEMNKKGG
jgi:hypothetical protein